MGRLVRERHRPQAATAGSPTDGDGSRRGRKKRRDWLDVEKGGGALGCSSNGNEFDLARFYFHETCLQPAPIFNPLSRVLDGISKSTCHWSACRHWPTTWRVLVVLLQA